MRCAAPNMAQITFTIPDNQLARVLAAFKKSRPLGVGDDNATGAQILRESVTAFIKRTVLQMEADDAAEAARTNALKNDIAVS